MFFELYRFLSAGRRRQLWLTVALMIAGTFVELLSIGAVIPFLGALLGQGAARAFNWSGAPLMSPLIALIVLTASVLSAGALRLLLLWYSQGLAARVGSDLAEGVLLRTLGLPYEEQVRRNSSATLSMVEQVHRAAHLVLLPILQAVTSGVIALALAAALLLIQPAAAICVAVLIVTSYLLLGLVSRRVLRRNAYTLSEAARHRTQIMQEAAGGIRDILLDNSVAAVVGRFAAPDRLVRRAQMINSVSAQAPRHVVETLAVLVVASIALAVGSHSHDLIDTLPSLGALVLGAQRLLPLLQQVYAGWSLAAGNSHALTEVLDMLCLPVETAVRPDSSVLPFERVELDCIDYAYCEAGPAVLRKVSMRIVNGEKLAIVGSTGCGKSTLLDVLMGLVEPQAGQILIDGVRLTPEGIPSWQAGIAHVPQSIFLMDDTVAANLAFPREAAAITSGAMQLALLAAALPEFAHADGLMVRVGERGVQLSGGQRQRIGVARALLRKPQLLILDEALNALDAQTEAVVLRNLRSEPRLTVVAVTHRDASLTWFDRVMALEGSVALSAQVHRLVSGTG